MPASTQGALLDGRYRVIRHLGSGGMASVVLARDERLDRLVAVKRLHADSPRDVERRFAREAKLGASLNHPNLVSIFDTAVDAEGVLIVMEYVPGEPLSAALRRGPLAPATVATIAREIGAALDHAHRHGVVHRDVKPGNVLLRDDGVTKLVDLGIATAADATRITRSGVVLGTASYMAPEQLDGREAGTAADVYALAAVCFEALCGARPRTGRTPVEIAHAVSTGPPPDLSEHWDDAPGAAAELLKRGMARDPVARPGSAGELARSLATALDGPPPTEVTRALPAPAPRSSAPPPSSPPSPSRRGGRLGAALIAVGLLALAAGAIGFALSTGDDEPSPPDATQPRGQAERREGERAERPERTTPTETEQEPAPAPEEPQPAPEEPQPAPEEPATPPATGDGSELNAQGFDLLNQGSYAEAVPVLQSAVAALEGSDGLDYAYALFNLGRALRLAGRPAEAVPILEQRLQIPNQTGTVRRELEEARRAAGG